MTLVTKVTWAHTVLAVHRVCRVPLAPGVRLEVEDPSAFRARWVNPVLPECLVPWVHLVPLVQRVLPVLGV